MQSHDKELKSMRFASALYAYKDLVSVIEHHGSDYLENIQDAITIEVIEARNPGAYSGLDELKPEFIELYMIKLKEAWL